MQFPFPLALRTKTSQGNSRGRKDGEDRDGYDQLDQRQARLAAAARSVLHTGPYCTCTAVWEPVMLTACCALFFAEARTTAMLASPAALAWNVRTQTVPEPLTPGTPGGREAEITTFPAPSSR